MLKNRKLSLLLTCISSLSLLASCSNNESVAENMVLYSKSNLIHESFDGLGVEWGVYEDTNKVAKGQWDRIYRAVDRLNPKLVRCMTNLDWVVKNFDNKGNSDPSDDTWDYDFNNKYMNNACDILDYCEAHNIEVAFGIWNVIGKADESDGWNMIKTVSSDVRWPRLCGDLMEYLTKTKGYTCIKYFVNTNEPNYTGAKGSSKNAFNTYDIWETGVKNLRKRFDDLGLQKMDIVGGDTTGFNGCAEYLPNIARNLSDIVKNYGIHMYISNYDIDTGTFKKNLSTLYTEVQKLDSKLGKEKEMIIWESGLLDGKNVQTDCNAYIGNFSYGIRMADYTVQSVLAGMNGIVYWDLDDGMHFMYGEQGMTPKEWGMFSSLNDSTSNKQEYRPWYHSSTILTNLLTRDSKIYSSTEAKEEASFRTLASIDKDGKNGGFVAVNRATNPITKSFVLEQEINPESDDIYVYIFNEQNLRLDENGFVTESFSFKGSLNKITEIEIPANSVVVVSSRRL